MMRVKYCKLCKKDFPVMFRIQYNSTKNGFLLVKIVCWRLKKIIHITSMEGLGKSDV